MWGSRQSHQCGQRYCELPGLLHRHRLPLYTYICSLACFAGPRAHIMTTLASDLPQQTWNGSEQCSQTATSHITTAVTMRHARPDVLWPSERVGVLTSPFAVQM